MDNEQKKLDSVQPLEFTWSIDGANMSSGFTAQEIDIANVTTTCNTAGSVYTITDTITDTIDLGGVTIGGISSMPTNSISGVTIGGISSMPTNSISGVNEINTANGKRIDLEELADVVETIKKRLLIITPNFELHEKYPMLKELYDEYKVLEKLLGGPDRKLNEDL